MRYSVDQQSVNQIQIALQNFEKKLQRRIARKGLRKLGERLKQGIINNIYWDDKELKRNIRIRVKSYKRGNLIWMGVGYIERPADDWRIKVRAHSYDKGWRAYPKGRPTDRKGKDWRKGLRRLGGHKIWITRFLSKEYETAKRIAPDILLESIREVIRETNPSTPQK